MHLNYSDGESRDGVSASFDQLFQPQPPDLNSLKSNEKVWALFDLRLSGLRRELSDRPKWAADYYPALVCVDQMGVPPQCVRVVYCGTADKCKGAIVPAEVQTLGKRFPGLVQVSRSELSAGVRAARGGAPLEPGLSCAFHRALPAADT